MRKKCRQFVSPELRLAHFYSCPTIPDQYYQCLDCIYYAPDEDKTAHNCSTNTQDADDDQEEGVGVGDHFDAGNSEDEAYEFKDDEEDENEEKEKSEESVEEEEEMSEDESLTSRRSKTKKQAVLRPELHCKYSGICLVF